MKLALFVALVAAPILSTAISPTCYMGAQCIKSQGTMIPTKQVIEITDYCTDFVFQDVGRTALRLSTAEMLARTGGRVTPLARAYFAFDHLRDSPLRFERKANLEDHSYEQIRTACAQLDRDFNDKSKWTR